ncbi:hypothetical protein Hypma_003323 [Hypsizygus marmoreus]|uniref:Uncharacterized protein n=1 Tax=Hypsizygus marmoreus TaxID=39966 RepID=A0A369J8W0_HYPMA|nr:hypothetical protein Hypma_003323 [Hypsizygus marmoreus]
MASGRKRERGRGAQSTNLIHTRDGFRELDAKDGRERAPPFKIKGSWNRPYTGARELIEGKRTLRDRWANPERGRRVRLKLSSPFRFSNQGKADVPYSSSNRPATRPQSLSIQRPACVAQCVNWGEVWKSPNTLGASLEQYEIYIKQVGDCARSAGQGARQGKELGKELRKEEQKDRGHPGGCATILYAVRAVPSRPNIVIQHVLAIIAIFCVRPRKIYLNTSWGHLGKASCLILTEQCNLFPTRHSGVLEHAPKTIFGS